MISMKKKMLECLEEDIAKLEPGNALPLIILGEDINLPSIIWENSRLLYHQTPNMVLQLTKSSSNY